MADQYERAVVFRLGRYNRTAGPGLYFLLPLLDRQVKLDLRTITRSVEAQEGITRDNVPIKVNGVIWFRITDPERAVLRVRDVENAVIQVSLTTLRTVLGQHSMDELLKSQDSIAETIQRSIDAVTEPWGVEVERVQMKNIEIPPYHAARHGAGGRGLAGETGQDHQSGRRARSRRPACAMPRKSSCKTPPGLELRRMQMITEVGAEQNTMTIIMMPSEFVAAARAIGRNVDEERAMSLTDTPIDNDIAARKTEARAWFEKLQDRLIAAFEALEDAGSPFPASSAERNRRPGRGRPFRPKAVEPHRPHGRARRRRHHGDAARSRLREGRHSRLDGARQLRAGICQADAGRRCRPALLGLGRVAHRPSLEPACAGRAHEHAFRSDEPQLVRRRRPTSRRCSTAAGARRIPTVKPFTVP